ncbi:diguanylate cyclase (GGDEF)-like protein [Pseudomonas duriflava]|uniref:diguanylate cyclase n=1 Tax=Pseudomonas duriflava TaxID=459528 RepID=A0A562QKZ5_9PSED|nr:sensor domain-containing diguanylate cyclase [Pseudomonas duriflava]TWI57432.1 diguanylate cyclase (GGDEF)-like protein [Pseudomonas duriflava]
MGHPSSTRTSFRRLPLEALTLSFLGLVFLSLAGLELWQGWTAHGVAVQRSEEATANLTKSLAQHAEDALSEVDIALIGLQHQLELQDERAFQRESIRALLKKYKAALEQVEGLFVFDQEGRWLATSMEYSPWKGSNADRDYFDFHRRNTNPDLHIGSALHSRTTGNWVIPVSRRLYRDDGRFAGVILATLKMDYFLDFYKDFEIDESGVIVLAIPDGTILARRPFKDEYLVGRNLEKSYVFTTSLQQSSSGIVSIKAVIDGVERLYGYQRLEKYPLVVMAALSRKALLAGWENHMWRSAYIVLALSLIMGAFGIVLLRQIRYRKRIEVDLIEARNTLERQAMSDGLTGLANRRYFDMALPQEMKRAARTGQPLGLIMIDIDYFKGYNDLYGHPAGDQCLKAVAEVIQSALPRTGDVAARYGGEEMAVLLPGCEVEGALVVAERIKKALDELNIPHGNSPYGRVTFSGGVHACRLSDSGMLGSLELVELADQALYQAKHAGRNQIATLPVTA